MKWHGKERGGEYEEGEPALRSCWECNGAHEHLKTVNTAHWCFGCGRTWLFDRFFDSFEGSDDAMTAWWTDTLGLALGDSSTKRDGGYRVSIITTGPSTC